MGNSSPLGKSQTQSNYETMPSPLFNKFSKQTTLKLAFVAVAAFQLSYLFNFLSGLMVVYLGALLWLVFAPSFRWSFYTALAVGTVNAAIQMGFFWRIFSGASILLWIILGFWIALFVLLARGVKVRFGDKAFLCAAPFLWTGLEYFRSELYYLRFSWGNEAYLFAHAARIPAFLGLGMYGVGFCFMGVVCAASLGGKRMWITLPTLAAMFSLFSRVQPFGVGSIGSMDSVEVAGIQREFPSVGETLVDLEELSKAHPEAQLLVLSEYATDGEPAQQVKSWCRRRHKFLILGGKDPAGADQFYDTVFVMDDHGEVVFKQAKAIPLPLFKDGLPALRQKVWNSPWGRIGICICYDLSHTRVTDELIRQGARMIIQPTMDLEVWGKEQHELHAMVAPIRAAEYGVPIFRVASSGISQIVNCRGEVTASAPMPGDGSVIHGRIELASVGHLPPDRWLAPFSVCITLFLIAFLILEPTVESPKPKIYQETK